METKANPNPKGCFARALMHEPMLILLGRDACAPRAIRAWADDRSQQSVEGIKHQDAEQIVEALETAEAMEAWRIEHDGEWRDAMPSSLPATLMWIDDDSLIDVISDAIGDSIDMGWNSTIGAKAVVELLRKLGEGEGWWPIGLLSDDAGQVLAETDDGRQMIWDAKILRGNLNRIAAGREPDHLQFPATRFCFLPRSRKASEGAADV